MGGKARKGLLLTPDFPAIILREESPSSQDNGNQDSCTNRDMVRAWQLGSKAGYGGF